MTAFDPSATASDVARSRRQAQARRLADLLVAVFGLNRPGFFATEFVQKIQPVASVETRNGPLHFRAGHGRLVWRVETFHTEEPETVRWIDSFRPTDVFWDVGANVGTYALYAARAVGCPVVAFEPEAQNFALLMENIALNDLGGKVTATNLALTEAAGLGRLAVHAVTKGGAYNQFVGEGGAPAGAITQLTMGMSMDELVARWGLPMPTHIKIDVDGNEPQIVAGGKTVLGDERCRSALVEVRTDLPEHMAIVDQMAALGFRLESRRSNWESRVDRSNEAACPADNMIFKKG